MKTKKSLKIKEVSKIIGPKKLIENWHKRVGKTKPDIINQDLICLVEYVILQAKGEVFDDIFKLIKKYEIMCDNWAEVSIELGEIGRDMENLFSRHYENKIREEELKKS